MASSRQQQSRVERERAQQYALRQRVHREGVRRKTRDNWIAGIVGGVVVLAAIGAQVLYFGVGPGAPESEPTATASAEVPSSELAEGATWTGDLVLNDDIDLGISLDGAAAPQAVSNFIALADEGFYDGVTCHRITTGDTFKVLQCGDPNGDGTGGPGYEFGPIENAPDDGIYPAGAIAMARGTAVDSQGSQFFIVYGETSIPSADGYTVFGTVTSGLDTLVSEVADAGVASDDAGFETGDGAPAVPTTITSVTVTKAVQ